MTSIQERMAPFAPLEHFYGGEHLPLPPYELIDGQAMPEPYRSLLVNTSDMTSTLQRFHDRRIHIDVMKLEIAREELRRQVILRLVDSHLPVEFGCIFTNLALFEGEARRQILECWRPFGGILKEHGIRFRSRPNAFFRVMSDAVINEALLLEGAQPL